MPTDSDKPAAPFDDFSLVSGGPFFRLMQGTLGQGRYPMTPRNAVILALLLWLPLLVLSALEGQFLPSTEVTVPFLYDFELHARLLVALPLLILAEAVTHSRMKPLLSQFFERGLVPDETLPQFQKAIDLTLRLRNSAWFEALLVVGVYLVGLGIWREYIVLDSSTWYAVPRGESMKPSIAGIFYAYISLPIFQFILLRWLYRLIIWGLFLIRISRIDLALVPSHPDRFGGLSFVPNLAKSLSVFASALGTLLAGWMATRIMLTGSRLTDFSEEIGMIVVLALCVILGPLLAFVPLLHRTQRLGRREYGALASRYVRGFDTKWIRGDRSPDDHLIGTGDIQSLADLGNSYQMVRAMRVIPITFELVQQIVVATLLPVAPLLLTMMPMKDLVKKLVSILF